MTPLLQTAYSDVVRDDPAARARLRITPDALINLPNFHCACSWIADGARLPSFVAQTLPMEQDDARIERHLEQPARARRPLPRAAAAARPARRLRPGARVPAARPNGAGAADGTTPRSPNGSATAGAASNGAPARKAHAEPSAPDFAPEAIEPPRRRGPGRRRADSASPARSTKPLPDSYTELDIEDITGLRWEQPPPGPHKPPLPRHDDLEILAALLRAALPARLADRAAVHARPGAALRPAPAQPDVPRRLAAPLRDHDPRRAATTSASTRSARGRLRAAPGEPRPHRARARHRPRGQVARPRGRRPARRPPRPARQRLAVRARGAAATRGRARLARPARRGPRRRRARRSATSGSSSTPTGCRSGPASTSADLQLDEFEPIRPDLAVELDLSLEGAAPAGRASASSSTARAAPRRTSRSSAATTRCSTAGRSRLPRYKMLGEPPIVVFVVEDEERRSSSSRPPTRW